MLQWNRTIGSAERMHFCSERMHQSGARAMGSAWRERGRNARLTGGDRGAMRGVRRGGREVKSLILWTVVSRISDGKEFRVGQGIAFARLAEPGTAMAV